MQPQRQQELDEQWLDALLTEAYKPDSRSRQRIAAVMQQLDSPPATTRARAGPGTVGRTCPPATIAASLLVLATFVLDNSQQRAYAAVTKSARPSPQVRLYRLHMISGRPGLGPGLGRREMSADLYIDPANRFLLKHPGMLGFGTALDRWRCRAALDRTAAWSGHRGWRRDCGPLAEEPGAT